MITAKIQIYPEGRICFCEGRACGKSKDTSYSQSRGTYYHLVSGLCFLGM